MDPVDMILIRFRSRIKIRHPRLYNMSCVLAHHHCCREELWGRVHSRIRGGNGDWLGVGGARLLPQLRFEITIIFGFFVAQS